MRSTSDCAVESKTAGKGVARGISQARPVRGRPDLMARLHTGCVYEPQPAGTFGVLVTRSEPRREVSAAFGAWWPQLAPTLALITARHPDGTPLGWEAFAARYRAELEALPGSSRVGATVQLGLWLRRHPTVTLLSFEHAPFGDEERVRAQRRILYAWLLGGTSSFTTTAVA